MNVPAVFPDWVPWWVPLVVLLPLLLYALAFLFMPFSVIGLKQRLDVMDARLEEIQNEIRVLATRLPAPPSRHSEFDDGYVAQPPPPRPDPVTTRPPIPPAAPHDLLDGDYPEDRVAAQDRPPPPPHTRPVRSRADMPVSRSPRSEPRLDWPR